jgi:hypothetical protein
MHQMGDAANAGFRQGCNPDAGVDQVQMSSEQRSQARPFFQHALLKADAPGNGGPA